MRYPDTMKTTITNKILYTRPIFGEENDDFSIYGIMLYFLLYDDAKKIRKGEKKEEKREIGKIGYWK